MAASVTVDFSTVTRTIPNHFAMIDLEAYDNESYPDQNLRDMIYGLGAEGYRVIAHMASTGNPGSPDAGWLRRLQTVQYLANRAVSQDGRSVGLGLGILSGPLAIPSHADPRGAGDIGSGDRSPANAKAWLDYCKTTLGLTVEWMEFINEPGTQAGVWWTSPVSGYSDLSEAGADWAAVHMRQFWDPIIAAPTSHGATRLCACADAGPYDGEMLEHITGAGVTSSVLADSNANHFDSFSQHAGYGSSAIRNTTSAATRQSLLNCTVDPIFYDGGLTKSGYRGTMNEARRLLDANGAAAKFMDDTEWQPDGNWQLPYATNWLAGIMQTVQYIVAINNVDVWKLKSKSLMSGAVDDHTSPAYGGGLIVGHQGGPYQYSPRAYNLFQQVHPFCRTFKNQVSSAITSNPSTPGGSKSNPQDSLFVAAGNDGQGNGAVLICNIDLTNSVTVNFTVNGTPTGNITRVRLLQTDVQGNPLASSTIAPANAFAITLAPGEVTYLTLPGVTTPGGVGTGGGGGTSSTGTLGYTAIGASFGNAGTPYKFCNKITVPTGKTYRIDDLKAYVRGNPGLTGSEDLKGVIWADVAGLPGNVTAVLGSASIVGGGTPTAAGFQTFTPGTPPQLTAGDYWIGFIDQGNTGVAQIAFDIAAANTEQYKTDAGYLTIAAAQPFGVPEGTTTNKYSLYVDYTDVTGGGPSPPPPPPNNGRIVGGIRVPALGRPSNPAGRIAGHGGGGI